MKSLDILKLKSKFFITRSIFYILFMLIPIWPEKFIQFNNFFLFTGMIFYILFMVAQWFLLGKEIDHRLKIYYRVNSSMDRLVYRILLGKITFVLLFEAMSFLPSNWTKYCLWGVWILLGLFYSWPTRGKIIEETISRQLHEYKFLDSFERTILGLTLILFVISIPDMPPLENIEALKLSFDPALRFGQPLWNFLSMSYFPFERFPRAYSLAWFLHFYIVGMGLFFMGLYALLRFFLSRRVSILGSFALISSWSFCLIIGQNVGLAYSSTFSLIWVWAYFWCTKSSTYRSGLFIGMLGFWGTVINHLYFFLLPIALFLLYFFSLEHKIPWFKRQLLKYASFGLVLALITFLMREESFDSYNSFDLREYFEQIIKILNRKAFFSLGIVGFFVFIGIMAKRKLKLLRPLNMDRKKLGEFTIIMGIFILFSLVVGTSLIEDFFIMWIVTFFGLIPLEGIFQSISRLRSRRNLIYMIYVIICLLDSHFEGRVKILVKLLMEM